MYEIDEAPALDKKRKHDIEVVVDRLVVRPGIEGRLADSFETALQLADGLAFAEEALKGGESGERTTFSAKFACPVSGFTIDEIEPRLFSFNNPFGACPSCDGLGITLFFDPELVVPEPGTTPARRAPSHPGPNRVRPTTPDPASPGAPLQGLDATTAWQELPEAVRDAILIGSGASR